MILEKIVDKTWHIVRYQWKIFFLSPVFICDSIIRKSNKVSQSFPLPMTLVLFELLKYF